MKLIDRKEAAWLIFDAFKNCQHDYPIPCGRHENGIRMCDEADKVKRKADMLAGEIMGMQFDA